MRVWYVKSILVLYKLELVWEMRWWKHKWRQIFVYESWKLAQMFHICHGNSALAGINCPSILKVYRAERHYSQLWERNRYILQFSPLGKFNFERSRNIFFSTHYNRSFFDQSDHIFWLLANRNSKLIATLLVQIFLDQTPIVVKTNVYIIEMTLLQTYTATPFVVCN